MEKGYFVYLIQKLRDIRSSERSAMAKIGDIISLSIDYSTPKVPIQMRQIREWLENKQNVERFANYLLLMTEEWAQSNKAWVMSDIDKMVREFAVRFLYKPIPEDSQIFCYTCYNGIYNGEPGTDLYGIDGIVKLPPELQSNQYKYVVLRVMDMNRLIETCSAIKAGSGYARPYDILAELDHRVVGSMLAGKFPALQVVFIDGSEKGFVFEFSHFEVDMQEPDPKFRTLYVVYRYDSIVS